MALRGTRLGLSGVPGRFAGKIVKTVGAIASTVSLTGSSDSPSAASGSFLARGIFTGVGASIFAGTGTINATVSFVSLSSPQRTHLTPYGVSGRFLPTPNKAPVTQKDWGVIETLGISLTISDFDSRQFFLVNSLGIALSPTAYHGASNGVIVSTVSFTGISGTVTAAVGLSNNFTTFSGAGAGVVTTAADGAISSLVTFAGQGNIQSSIFSQGAGAIHSSVSFSSVGQSTNAATGAVASSVTFAGAGGSVFAADGLIASTVTFDGLNTIYGSGAGSLTSAVSFTGVGAANFGSVGLIQATTNFAAIATPVAGPAQTGGILIEVTAPTIQIEVTSSNIRIEVAA